MKNVLAAILVSLISVLAADFFVVRLQINSMERRLGGRDFFERMTASLAPGMERTEAEDIIRGFRELDVDSEEGKYSVRYGYWFGFIPPLSKSGLKFIGEVRVAYSTDGRLLEASYWYN